MLPRVWLYRALMPDYNLRATTYSLVVIGLDMVALGISAGSGGGSLGAGTTVPLHHPPALANVRVQRNAAGQVVLNLKAPWREGN